MGTLYNFGCGSCGYAAELSGGEDCGMTQATTTIFCQDCHALYDVVTSEDSMTHKPERELPIHCPQSSSHRWRLWTHPGPCPKCGATMVRGEETLIWD
jgi:hypothetical protein